MTAAAQVFFALAMVAGSDAVVNLIDAVERGDRFLVDCVDARRLYWLAWSELGAAIVFTVVGISFI